MQQRRLGNSNLEVSALGLGCMGMSQSYGLPPAIRLTADDLREIESAASHITIQGARYPEQLEKRTGL